MPDAGFEKCLAEGPIGLRSIFHLVSFWQVSPGPCGLGCSPWWIFWTFVAVGFTPFCSFELSCWFWFSGLWGAHPILDRDEADLTYLGSVSLCCYSFSCGLSSFGFPLPRVPRGCRLCGFPPSRAPSPFGETASCGNFPRRWFSRISSRTLRSTTCAPSSFYLGVRSASPLSLLWTAMQFCVVAHWSSRGCAVGFWRVAPLPPSCTFFIFLLSSRMTLSGWLWLNMVR